MSMVVKGRGRVDTVNLFSPGDHGDCGRVESYIPHICERISPEFPAGRLDQR
jgi:hypothetical protein